MKEFKTMKCAECEIKIIGELKPPYFCKCKWQNTQIVCDECFDKSVETHLETHQSIDIV